MFEKELEVAIEAAKRAVKGILEIYHTQFDVEIKEDNSPVTLADKGADKLIREYLSEKFPDYGMLTEESNDDLSRLKKDYIWIVDPVDGTKDFVARDDEFTTNIALAYKGQVVVGVVSIPAKKEIYYASKNNGAFYDDGKGNIQKIHVNDKTEDLTMLTSRFHVSDLEHNYVQQHSDKIKTVKQYGSALKACLIAKGEAEISIRFNNGTKEWDTAASQCVIEEAGGLFVKPNGEPLTYNREDVYNREGYYILNRIENKF
ncbi:MAG: 3'(2'),5'-bisphosphate nucleotidase CysQ [Bacilli bacterium]